MRQFLLNTRRLVSKLLNTFPIGGGDTGFLHFDTMTDTNGTDATAHVAEIRQSAYTYALGSGALIQSNQLEIPASPSAAIQYSIAEGQIKTTVVLTPRRNVVTTSSRTLGQVRFELDVNNIYYGGFDPALGTSTLFIYKTVGGSFVVAASLGVPDSAFLDNQEGTFTFERSTKDLLTVTWVIPETPPYTTSFQLQPADLFNTVCQVLRASSSGAIGPMKVNTLQVEAAV